MSARRCFVEELRRNRILAVANQLHAMWLDAYEDTLLFTEALRTTEEHPRTRLRYIKLKGWETLTVPKDQLSGENGYDL